MIGGWQVVYVLVILVSGERSREGMEYPRFEVLKHMAVVMVDLDCLWRVVYRCFTMLEASDRSSGTIYRLAWRKRGSWRSDTIIGRDRVNSA